MQGPRSSGHEGVLFTVSPTSSPFATPAPEDYAPRFRLAFEKILPEMLALVPAETLQVNFDVPTKVTQVLGSLPHIRALRAEIVTHLPTFDVARFDKLEDYVLALSHPHSESMSIDSTSEELQELNERATRQRNILLAIAQLLVLWGLLHRDQIAQFRGAAGYRVVSYELTGLTSLLRKEWATVGPRTGLQPSELLDADHTADQMLTALGARERNQATREEELVRRNQAFTLFIRAYRDAERAIHHLRWEQGDADTIIPSLYSGRSRRPSKPEDEAPQDGAPVDPAVPVASPVTPAAPAAPAAPASPAAPLVPGGPGGNPFIR